MTWSFPRLRLLVFFFVTQVLLLSLDLTTDIITGTSIFYSNDLNSFEYSLATFIVIFLPSIWAFVAFLWSLIRRGGKRFKTCFAEFIFELPFFNILKKLGYFLQLCFMDTECPHNFDLISEIRRLAISASAYEAFLESVPQLFVQTNLIYTYYSSNLGQFQRESLSEVVWQILTALTSFLSCSLASFNLFVLQRPGYYSDSNPSFKVKLIFIPIIGLVGALVCFFWFIATGRSVIFLFLALAFPFGIQFIVSILCKRDRSIKIIMNECVASWFAPYIPWTGERCKTIMSLSLNMVCVSTPLIFGSFLRLSIPFFESKSTIIFASAVPGLFVVCGILHWLGSYSNLYKVSKIFKLCSLKPIVHRSMIIDWLKNKNSTGEISNEDSIYPDFFEQFIAGSIELNQPELENWDTVLHFAFRENQFDVLIRIIKNGGNPFIRNKNGESINLLVKSLAQDQDEIEDRLKEAIAFFSKNFPCGDQESVVHSAARNNQLKWLKMYKFFQASFDSYNNKRQKPVEIAMECGHLEVALYLMQHTHGLFPLEEQNTYDSHLTTYSQEPNLRTKCYQFLLRQSTESLDDLKDKYPIVFDRLLHLRDLEAGNLDLTGGLQMDSLHLTE